MNLNLGQSKKSSSQPTPELSSPVEGGSGGQCSYAWCFPAPKGPTLKCVVPWQTLGDAVPCHSCEWAAITAGLRTPGPP